MRTVIENGVLWDAVTPGVRPATVVVEGDRIADVLEGHRAVAADARVDAAGRTVMPGLVNMHAHLSFMYAVGHPGDFVRRPDHLLYAHAFRISRVLLAQGITRVRDMGGPRGIHLHVRDLIRDGVVLGPHVTACGEPLVATGRHAYAICEEADGPEGVVTAVRNQFKQGADFIKLMASDDPVPADEHGVHTRPGYSPDEVAAAYAEVRRHGAMAACHVMGADAIRAVLDAGADVIDHGHYLTPELARRMAADGTYLTPTLSSYDVQTAHPRFNRGATWAADHAPLLEGHRSALRAALDAGVRLLIGTDTVGCFAEEVALLRDAGMDAGDSLLAATRWACEALGVADEVGTVEVGKRADLAIVGPDVLADPYALEDTAGVVVGGVHHATGSLVTTESHVQPDLWALARSPRP
ncbi:amidohydrolase family protein [Cellulomonas sp. Sa3CUA2]|uniref:Amidohydrolase family protein n=1 Tax=Cellulomonas avistercoris TaxID=2762242 RepID=A0ABR8QGZ0_9CELL|nr:amidohydrolase family protein [Cellulomonas avistercoris]MBD7919621.1 amidohydrolase family protein [Cellulomonas avistercoris]